MTNIQSQATRRNARPGEYHLNVNHHPDHFQPALTLGGKVIYRRTHWSPSLCNAIASLAGFAEISR